MAEESHLFVFRMPCVGRPLTFPSMRVREPKPVNLAFIGATACQLGIFADEADLVQQYIRPKRPPEKEYLVLCYETIQYGERSKNGPFM